ncbi:MAG: putative metalloprotease [Gammaproteobacteria bacterium]|jgi:predicted metalloprotease
MGGGGLGIVVLALVAMSFGVDPAIVLQGAGMGGDPAPRSQQASDHPSAQDTELGDFVSVVLADTEDTWNELFPSLGQRYEEPRLVPCNLPAGRARPGRNGPVLLFGRQERVHRSQLHTAICVSATRHPVISHRLT